MDQLIIKKRFIFSFYLFNLFSVFLFTAQVTSSSLLSGSSSEVSFYISSD